MYGQDESYRILFEKLVYGLEDQNFEPSDYDHYMFVSDKVICLVYVCDFIWFSKYRKYIDGAIKYSRKEGSQYKWEMTQ